MEVIALRAKLLENVKMMCNYAERELDGCTTRFRYEYEHGFIFGWSSYNIAFSYNPTTKRAEITINWYRGRDYVFSKDGKVLNREDKDVTNSFLTNKYWCDADSMQKAIISTQNNWNNIKYAIQKHKEEEYRNWNFQV